MRRWPIVAVGLLSVGLVLGGLTGFSLSKGQGQPPAPPAVPKELTSYRDVVKQVLPAVVSIEMRATPTPVKGKQAPQRRQPFDDQQVPEQFRRFFEDFGQGPFNFDMDQQPRQGFGSGFLVDAKGIILTNNHVVDGADSVVITLQDGRKFTSTDIKKDPMTDLAIVRINTKEDLPYLRLGDSSAMEIGDRVLAVGAPFRLQGTVTAGIVSSKGRNLGMNIYEDFLQTDAAINPGNSGGPLVNLAGEVIGINSAIKTGTGGWQGVGLAVSSNLAKNVMDQLEKTGTVRRGFLGVHIKDIADHELAARLGVPKEGGVLVGQVEKNSPADKAGVKDGDVLTSVNGKPVHDMHDLHMLVASMQPGKSVELGLIRDGKSMTVNATIEEQPKDFAARQESRQRAPRNRERENAVSVEKIGVQVTDVSKVQADRLGLQDTTGAVIADVAQDSLADQVGLRPGMVVTKVDRQPVKSASAFKEALEKASLDKGVLLQTESAEGGTGYFLLRAAAAAK
jgi:serine protease Do